MQSAALSADNAPPKATGPVLATLQDYTGAPGHTNWNVGVAPGTSPSIAALPGGGFMVAFQAFGGGLWTVGTTGWTNWNVGLAPGTSPSIAALRGGGFEVAFQSSSGGLWTVGTAGWTNWNVGLSPGTSPSIAALPGGGFEVAFQAAGGGLWTVGSAGWANWNVGVAPRTSPSIAGLARGGYETAFQAFGGQLWTVGTAGWTNWNVGLEPGTSPSIAGLTRGGFETAFEAMGGQLWTVGTAGWTNWNAGVSPGTGPSIAPLAGGGFQTAFQGVGGQLWTVGAAGWTNPTATVAPGTMPRITAESTGALPVAYQGPDGNLWTGGSTSAVTPTGVTGIDISQYQCGDIPGGRPQIAVVQVTGGGINRPANACYPAEAAWAGSQIQAYIYMNGLPNPAPVEATNGPAGSCGGYRSCLGYNFGWAWAQHWVSYADSAGPAPQQWWLDVETNSGWTDIPTDNQIIRGALDALRSRGLSAGIYSSPRQWNLITGGLILPGMPLWVPGAGNLSGPGYTATEFCSDLGETFAGGVLKYVQYGYTGEFPGAYSGTPSRYDLDYAC